MLMVAWLLLFQAAPPSDLEKLLNQAEADQRAGKPDQAMERYREILSALKTVEPETAKRLAYVRSRAQDQLAVCLEATGKAEEALKAYQDSEKTPTGSWCGNAHTAHEAAANMGQGRCLESLGRHEEAILKYFKATEDFLNGADSDAVRRIVDLYEAAGKADSLRTVLARRDKEYFSQFKPEEGHRIDSLEQMNPNRPIKRLLGVRDAARLQEWNKLADILEVQGSLRFGHASARGAESIVDAAHFLSARPDKAVPLMRS